MLYPKTLTLNTNNLTELRIHKMEEQRQTNLSLVSNLNKYSQKLSELSALETKITDDLFALYTTDSSFSGLIHKLSKAVAFKAEIVQKNIALLKESLEKALKMEDLYGSLKPLVKNYFVATDKLRHYEKKVPKVVEQMEGRKKAKGQLSAKETDKLIRNKRKLENATIDVKVIHDCIVADTDSANIKRFGMLNPVLKGFIGAQIGVACLMNDKWAAIKDFESVLAREETALFNDKYFLDIEKRLRSRLMKDNADEMGRSADMKEQQVINQNVQNNYYYINHEPGLKQISQFDPEENIQGFNNDPKGPTRSFRGQVMNHVKQELDGDSDHSVELNDNGFGNNLPLPIMYR